MASILNSMKIGGFNKTEMNSLKNLSREDSISRGLRMIIDLIADIEAELDKLGRIKNFPPDFDARRFVVCLRQLSNALENVGGTSGNWLRRRVQKFGAAIIGRVYRWKLKRKLYKFAPELGLVRFLRHRLFYGKGENPFRVWTKFIGIHLDEHEHRQRFQARGWSR